MLNKSLFITGLMGSGKSYFGEKVAAELSLKFIDLDEFVETNEEMSITDIFNLKGESFFRALELSSITSLLEKKEPQLISLGGGAICFNNIDVMLRGESNLVYLKSAPENIYERIKSETHRPLLKNKTKQEVLNILEALLTKRKKNYQKAHLTLNVDELEEPKVLKNIREFYEQRTC